MTQQNLIEKYIANNFFGKHLEMNFKIINPGEVEYSLKIGPQHLATPHAAHGGAIAALADAALGVAGLSAVHHENKVVSTIEYKLNFLSPAFLNDELLAKAKIIQQGKRILIIECEVIASNRNNICIAKSMGTFNAYDAAKAGY